MEFSARSLDTMGPFWNAKMDIVARLPDMNGPHESLIRDSLGGTSQF